MGGLTIGDAMLTSDLFFIAEIGVNHNGSVDLAKTLIEAAVDAGADAVKFQSFSADKLANTSTPKVNYQLETTGAEQSHHQMLKELELSNEQFIELHSFCTKCNIEFISTPYDCASASFLVETLRCNKIKTASADIVDRRLHAYLAKSEKDIIVSTGMASLGEIEDCLGIYGEQSKKRVSLLHCVSAYPASDGGLNLSVISRLSDLFECRVGYSDHSRDDISAYIATSLGASIFEKHFTLDKEMNGPDHKASSTPQEFKTLIDGCKRVHQMLGKPVKKCQEEERQMKEVSRKSIHLVSRKESGEEIREKDLCLMRPGHGISPMDEEKVIGRRLARSKAGSSILNWKDLA